MIDQQKISSSGPVTIPSAIFDVAGKSVTVQSSDERLLEEIGCVLPRSSAYRADWTIRVTLDGDASGRVDLGLLSGHQDLTAGLGTVDFPFHDVGSDGNLALAFHGEAEPVLWVDEDAVRFSIEPRWRTVVSLLIYHKALRLRRDVIFFHASAVSIDGRGVMFVGPKGAGKSTTALALAARGHPFLGDETGAWRPADGRLVPFLRHIGIKPGPRSKQVDEALASVGRSPERDGILRCDVRELFPSSRVPAPVPLGAIVLLEGFCDTPRSIWRAADRKDLAKLQPMSGSMVNESGARRTFELTRMISSSRICELSPADPDMTAEKLEREVSTQWPSR